MEVPLLDLQHTPTLQSLLSEEDLSYKQQEIITILGGINVVLNHYIASGDLDDDRIQRIIAAIKNDSKLNAKAKDDTVDDQEILLNPYESISKCIFTESISKRLTALVRNKMVIMLFLAVFISMTIVVGIEWIVYSNHKTRTIFIFLRFPVMLYLIALVLCINVRALKLLSRTFLFWFQLFYFVQHFVLWNMLNCINNSWERGALYIIEVILEVINIVMVIILVSSMDGLYLSVWGKRAILSSILLYSSIVLSVYFLYGDEWWSKSSITVAGRAWHLVDQLRSSVQTLVIFIARQTIALWRNPTKCTVIGKPTHIRWNE